MQGLVLQLTRAGFPDVAVGVHLVGAADPADRYLCPTGAVMVRRGLALRGTLLPSRQRGHAAR